MAKLFRGARARVDDGAAPTRTTAADNRTSRRAAAVLQHLEGRLPERDHREPRAARTHDKRRADRAAAGSGDRAGGANASGVAMHERKEGARHRALRLQSSSRCGSILLSP